MNILTICEGGRVKRETLDDLKKSSNTERLRVSTIASEEIVDPSALDSEISMIDFFGERFQIVYKGLTFHINPRVSNSNGSKAIYIAELDNGARSYLLQLLPPNSVTSRHYHRITHERFHNLRGKCIINVDGTDMPLEAESLQVSPLQAHQVRTADVPSLNLIEMIGNPEGLVMTDHFYV